MVTKLVVGLTDVLSGEFVTQESIPEMFDSQTVSVDSYIIPTATSIVANETLEWTLNTELPAISGLLTTIEQMKTRIMLDEVTVIKRAPVGEHYCFSIIFGLLNYVPNPSVVYTGFTDDDYNSLVVYPRFGDIVLEEVHGYEINGIAHTSSLSYAVDHDTTNYLANAYPIRSAVPMFNVRFNIGERDNIPQHTMPLEFETWVNNNINELTAKGWELNNPKSRVGFYVAGRLVGDPWEQYLKLLNNPYICSIDVVEA